MIIIFFNINKRSNKYYLNLENVHKFNLLKNVMNVIYLFNENKRTSINYIKFKSYCVYNIIEMTNMFFFYKQYYYELREEEYNNTNIYVSNKKWKHQNSYIPFKKRHISEDYETLMKRRKFFRSVSIHDLKNNKKFLYAWR